MLPGNLINGFGFYPKSYEKLLNVLKQWDKIIRLEFLKAHTSCRVGNKLEEDQRREEVLISRWWQ